MNSIFNNILFYLESLPPSQSNRNKMVIKHQKDNISGASIVKAVQKTSHNFKNALEKEITLIKILIEFLGVFY